MLLSRKLDKQCRAQASSTLPVHTDAGIGRYSSWATVLKTMETETIQATVTVFYHNSGPVQKSTNNLGSNQHTSACRLIPSSNYLILFGAQYSWLDYLSISDFARNTFDHPRNTLSPSPPPEASTVVALCRANALGSLGGLRGGWSGACPVWSPLVPEGLRSEGACLKKPSH